MQVRVLGCSGGIGAGLRTTSFMLDTDILLDAGSGVGELTLDEMAGIRHVFLTHSHLDHVLALALLVDSVFDRIHHPLQVHALPATIEALRQHLFNNVIWPDFSRLPHPDRPVLQFVPLQPGEVITLDGRHFEVIPVNHTVPTAAYRITSATGVFAFSGDTTTNDAFWQALNAGERLDLLFVEAAFPDAEQALCNLARHYCPSLLAADLAKLQHQPEIWLTHAKPGAEDRIFNEIRALPTGREINRLSGGERFTV